MAGEAVGWVRMASKLLLSMLCPFGPSTVASQAFNERQKARSSTWIPADIPQQHRKSQGWVRTPIKQTV